MITPLSLVFGIIALGACAQPLEAPFRATRAITLVDSKIYLYGGSSPSGRCFSDLYHLHLSPKAGWKGGIAPWTVTDLAGLDNAQPISLNVNSYAVGINNRMIFKDNGSDDHTEGLFVYGQSLCPDEYTRDPSSPHPFVATSKSALIQLDTHHKGSQTSAAENILGPRLIKEDEPVPVQVVDEEHRVVYTFVYDANVSEQGMQLYSFSADRPELQLAKDAKRITMNLTSPSTQSDSSDGSDEDVVVANVTVPAPFVDVGSTVFWNGKIIVLGGGKSSAQIPLVGEDVHPISRLYKTDRCWIYDIATNAWSKRNLSSSLGTFPSPRRLAALAVGNDKIYLHGGNIPQSTPVDEYGTDLWILDTNTWEWTPGPDSPYGRASHTFVRYQDILLSISGFQFQKTLDRDGSNAVIMIYNISSGTWTLDFGVRADGFFAKHPVVLILIFAGGILLSLLTASLLWSYWKWVKTSPAFDPEMRVLRLDKAGNERKGKPRAREPGTASHVRRKEERDVNGGRATRSPSLPETGDSRSYELPLPPNPEHFTCESRKSLQKQQQVPLMSDDALEQVRVQSPIHDYRAGTSDNPQDTQPPRRSGTL
ncbi:hypothetical protein BGX28_001645 [Mortierella sp. GBA30]|nr:hypothetical protein BGX28_001645 [Mortierella sp. GBA30]